MKPITMEDISQNFGIYLIKFAEKEEYIDDLLRGKIYMKEAGYFRKLEDGYRGDKNDGKMPIDMTGETITLQAENGESISFNMVKDFQIGFSGDNKVPIFCAVLMDDKIIEICDDNAFKIKDEYLQEMQQFGKYVCFIPYEEMLQKIDQYIKAHPGIGFIHGPVYYCDIMSKYRIDEPEDENLGVYRRFFNKDSAYRKQHEWRLLAHSDEALIGDQEDHLLLDFGEFEYGVKGTVSMLLDSRFIMEREEEDDDI